MSQSIVNDYYDSADTFFFNINLGLNPMSGKSEGLDFQFKIYEALGLASVSESFKNCRLGKWMKKFQQNIYHKLQFY